MVKINGCYQSFSILEFTKTQSVYLQNLIQRDNSDLNSVFFEKHAYKKLGFKTLNHLPIIDYASGFTADNFSKLEYKSNRKLTLKMPLKMLHEKYLPINLFSNKTINSSIKAISVSYRKKSLCDYFLLKVFNSGTFNLLLPDEFDFLDLEVIHQNCLFKSMNQPIEQLVSFQMNSHEINFKQSKHNKTAFTLIQL